MTKKKSTGGKKGIEPASKTQPIIKKQAPIPDLPLSLKDNNSSAKANFPVVGIGASAGGLAAFEAFFSAMPADKDTGMAFVLVQHLAPDHESILSDIISRYTRMQVFEAEDGMMVRPDCTYIIPPNYDMAFLNGELHLLEPSMPRGQRLPIDFFFRSLAQEQQERAICIVLSGTGSDGTLGVRAVKGEGGLVIAQAPESTEYDGMPRSAIATGMVDYVLPPAEMPEQIIAYASHAFVKEHQPESIPEPKEENYLKKIFILLRAQTGHDFSLYKQKTIKRRIERRMAVHQVENINAYVHFLQQTPAEIEALFHDLLIGVTNFFRDSDAFDALEKHVIPKLFASKAPDAPVRVWVPGCSTGEEAYSIAILLQEHMESLKKSFRLQVFAADIDKRAIDTARAGVYPSSIASDVSPERLSRFFTIDSDGGSYRINKVIRDMLIFSEQDIVKDPPFSKLDLISCRNLLIYMGGELQKKIIPLFHYALNPGCFLFLGTSETIGDFVNLFTSVDRKAKIYQYKVDITGSRQLAMEKILPAIQKSPESAQRALKSYGESTMPLRELTERALLAQYDSVAILVNERGEVLYLHGRTGMYLEPAPGEFDKNILKMAREGLKRELTMALHRAVTGKENVFIPCLKVKTNGDFTAVSLTVRPVSTGVKTDMGALLFLIILEKAQDEKYPLQKNTLKKSVKKGANISRDEPQNNTEADVRIAALMDDLRAKEEYLQATNEEMETANEELKSSNEEMQSVNEELQSTNEELETSKEELQSINEELATVNAELQNKVADLSRANNDMNNLLAGTDIGTIFVDHQLRILRYTPAVEKTINLIKTDVGRPVGHIVSNLADYNSLSSDVKSVLDTLIPRELEVQALSGEWYMMRIQPYRTIENVIEGAVITFVNITEIKKMQWALLESKNLGRLAVVVRDSYDAITIQDIEGRILAWNLSAEKMYGWSEKEALSMNISERIPVSSRKKELAVIKRIFHSKIIEPYHTQRITKDGHVIDIWLTATALVNEKGEIYAIATTERNAKD